MPHLRLARSSQYFLKHFYICKIAPVLKAFAESNLKPQRKSERKRTVEDNIDIIL